MLTMTTMSAYPPCGSEKARRRFSTQPNSQAEIPEIALRSSATWLQVIVVIALLTIILSFTALSTAVLFYDLRARRQPTPQGG